MSSTRSERRARRESRSRAISRQGADIYSIDGVRNSIFVPVASSGSESGLSRVEYGQRQAEYYTSTLPTYEQTQNGDSITDAAVIAPGIDLETGISPTICSATVAGFDQTLPAYTPDENMIVPSDNEIIRLALQDAAVWKAGGRSAYHVPHAATNETENNEPYPGVFWSSGTNRAIPASTGTTGSSDSSTGLTDNQNRFLDAYFKVIRIGDDDLLRQILESGLVVPFPLIAAVKAKKPNTALLLVEYGAVVNGWYVMETKKLRSLLGYERICHVMRTPLQIAAQDGSLPLVKVLMETCHADDSLISPTDGQTALRLAAGAGHRHIVDYLPMRRGGAGLRWRAKWRVAATKINKNVTRIGEVLRGLLWYFPRAVIKELLIPGLKWVWKSLKELPETLSRFLRDTIRLIRGFPAMLVETARSIWHLLVRCVKAIPGFCTGLANFCWHGLCQLSGAIGHVFNRFVSLLHTSVVAIGTFFRNLTWTNLWHGLRDLLNAIFVRLPTTVWHLIQWSWTGLLRLLNKVSGLAAFVVEGVIWVVWWTLSFFPQKAFAILFALGEIAGHAFQELIIWWNPKHVTV